MSNEKSTETREFDEKDLNYDEFRGEILKDYQLICESREASLLGRKEVLTGKAKFGIFGDGKELAQIAQAKAFKKGDFRAGYYRDQTLMFALGNLTFEEFFAQIYGTPDLEIETHSAGRQMNAHFATQSLNPDGSWKNLMEQKNSSADMAPTASQMPRTIGLGLASKLYRHNEELHQFTEFSNKGNEVTFCNIGDSSTSEGVFLEAINAACVQKLPIAFSVWDDGYGISVPIEYQTTKSSISKALRGFELNKKGEGMDIYKIKAWDYISLCEGYEKGIAKIRETHIPALFHIEEVTQQIGHSTSGSHERYKTKERLQWEIDFDCVPRMRQWLLEIKLAQPEELDTIEQEAKDTIKAAKKAAWGTFLEPIKKEIAEVNVIYDQISAESANSEAVIKAKQDLNATLDPIRRDVMKSVKSVLRTTLFESIPSKQILIDWKNKYAEENKERYNSFLYSQSEESARRVKEVKPVYSEASPMLQGFEILNKYFDHALANNPKLVAFGEDVGQIGDVNQGFAGLQEKYGKLRVFDTGIRELTIIGQGIGLAMRGLRPIAEIQYLDYLVYGFQPITDDLATVQYRTKGRQKAPLIIRTRGHRLEGIWHTGSPIGMILNAIKGVYFCLPRNMTQAAGFYNTMLQSDDPALIIECLNGYRLKEKLPDNIADITIPLGIPEVLQEGNDVTLVTYGSCIRIAEEAITLLQEFDISVELIDVQTLIPFDINQMILESLKKTNRIVFLDEDVPGGATAFMLEEVLEKQGGYYHLDSMPTTITSKDHRTPYGSDGDYFTKQGAEDVFEGIYKLMHESDPGAYPELP